MRTTGDDPTTETRPLGDEDGSQSGETVTPVGTESGPSGDDTGGGFGTETGTGTDRGEPDEGFGSDRDSDSSGDFGPDGDTEGFDDLIADLSDEEAEQMVDDIFESVYGDEADGILQDLQETLGLDSHQILEILLGEPGGGGAYGDGDESGADEPEVDNAAFEPAVEDTAGTGDFGVANLDQTLGDVFSGTTEDAYATDNLVSEATADDLAEAEGGPEPADDPLDFA